MRARVLIDIAGFANKGDQLMFCSLVESVHARLPEADLVLPAKLLASCDLRRLSDLPFRELADCRKVGRRISYGLKWLLSCVRICRPPVYPSQIDVVLHSPGFRYSDSFPLRRVSSLRKELAYFRAFSKKGRRIFFMPQAFGPFVTDASRQRMLALYPFADWLYARDEMSLAYLRGILPHAENISLAPDFTCGCQGRRRLASPLLTSIGGRCGVIIPNGRMISHTALGAQAYLDFLCTAASLFRRSGLDVILLNHEGEDDMEILSALRRRLAFPVVCLNGETGLVCKGIIGGAAIVVTSRFHGAVSGLCQGVPTLCTGWSHKYRELAEKFGCGQCCLDIAEGDKALAVLMDALRQPERYSADQAHIKAVLDETDRMWDGIFGRLPR